MCGISVSNNVNFFNDSFDLIRKRGPDYIFEYEYSGFKFLQTILSIREPVSHKCKDLMEKSDLLILYNGEIFNSLQSDTEFIIETAINLFNAHSKNEVLLASEKNINFDMIQEIHRSLNQYEGEYALVIFQRSTKLIYFFTDDIGRRSLSFSLMETQSDEYKNHNKNYFTVSSVKYDSQVNPSYFYCYDIQSNELFLCHKKGNTIQRFSNLDQLQNDFLLNYSLQQIQTIHSKNIDLQRHFEFQSFIQLHDMNNKNFLNICSSNALHLLLESVKSRTTDLSDRKQICVAFSGGIDSFLSVLLLDQILPCNIDLILINTSVSKDSFDHLQSKFNFEALSKKLERSIQYIYNELNATLINEHISSIHDHVHSEDEYHMNMNIAIIHYFTALKGKEYGNILFTGNGADEIFMGYSKYLKKKDKHDQKIDLDLYESNLINLYKRNIHRDDRVIAHHGLEMRSIFLDLKLIEFVLNLVFNAESQYRIEIQKKEYDFREFDHKMIIENLFLDINENKKILRQIIRSFGYEEQANVTKKAMQFGSGLKKIENQIFYRKDN